MTKKKMEIVICLFAILGLSMAFCNKVFATPKKYAAYSMQWYTCNIDDVKSMYTVKEFLDGDYEIKACVKGMNGFAKDFTDYTAWNTAWADIQKWNNPSKPQNLFLYDMGLGAQKVLIIVNNDNNNNNNNNGNTNWNNIYMFTLKKVNKKLQTKTVGADVEKSAKATKVASSRASDAKEDLEWSEE